MNKKKKSTNTSPYPDEVIDRLARAFYTAILACWNSEEGQTEFAAWQAEQAHHTTSKEKQTILAAGAGASTKVVLPSDQPEVMESRIERCENVKDVSQYIERIDEMIERKEQFFCKNGI